MQTSESRSSDTGVIDLGGPMQLVLVHPDAGSPISPPFDISDFTPSWKPLLRNSLLEFYEERFPSKSDDAGAKSSHDTWNYFEHYKRTNEFNEGVSDQYTALYSASYFHRWRPSRMIGHGWRSQFFGSLDNPTLGLPALYEKSVTTGSFVKRITNLDATIQLGLRTMLSQVRPEQSLLNNLYELKDFKTLPRTLQRIDTTLRRLVKEIPRLSASLRHLIDLKGRKTLLGVLGAASDAFLQEEFNISPLLRDILGVQNAISTERKRIAKLIAREGIKTRRDFRLSLANDYQESIETQDSGASQNLINTFVAISNARSMRVVRYPVASFHAQIEYTYLYYSWQKQNAQALAILDKLGVMFNPSIIWNAIPWTFVIDWVVDVNRFLDQYSMSNMEPVTVVHKFCWSQHLKRVITCSNANMAANSNKGIGSPMKLANSCTEESYLRSPEGLNITAALTGSGISLKEFILGTALKTSRFQ